MNLCLKGAFSYKNHEGYAYNGSLLYCRTILISKYLLSNPYNTQIASLTTFLGGLLSKRVPAAAVLHLPWSGGHQPHVGLPV